MTRYIGCEYARERLERFVDEELTVDEQVAVESHVRWCRTCELRIEDMRLIGAAVRLGSPARNVDRAADPVRSRVLLRLRAEQDQALAVRVRELFVDMRLLWPALGATFAVIVCVAVALGVLRRAAVERPESLAMMIEAVGNPGSERNPLRPDNRARIDPFFAKYVDSDRAGGISIPRVEGEGAGLDSMPNREAMFTMSTVVSREGRIANYELLREPYGPETARGEEEVAVVLDAVRRSRFAPAQTPVGRAVAVNMVWVLFFTTVHSPAVGPSAQVVPTVAPPASPAVEAEEPATLGRSSPVASPTA